MGAWGPLFYYRIVISMIRCNFLLGLKKSCGVDSELPVRKVLETVASFLNISLNIKFRHCTGTKVFKLFALPNSSKGPVKYVA